MSPVRADGVRKVPVVALNDCLKPAQIVRHAAEFLQHLGVAEFTSRGIAGAAERDRADVAQTSRQRFGAAQRTRRTLALFRAASDRRAAVVLQERQRYVVGDIGHCLAFASLSPSIQAALLAPCWI